MTLKEHKKQIKQLDKLERELMDLIFKNSNTELMEKFMEWQEQRTLCNSGFYEHLNEVVNENLKR